MSKSDHTKAILKHIDFLETELARLRHTVSKSYETRLSEKQEREWPADSVWRKLKKNPVRNCQVAIVRKDKQSKWQYDCTLYDQTLALKTSHELRQEYGKDNVKVISSDSDTQTHIEQIIACHNGKYV
jgi:hypothetical protein